jgi:hypothetical protein
VGKSGVSGRFFFSVGVGPFRIGTSSSGVLDGITGEGLVWVLLFGLIGLPILAVLFESFFFIVFVLLLSLVLVAVSFTIFELAVSSQVEKGIRVGGASPILTPLGGVVLGIPTAAIYLLCLYRIPLVGRDWDNPNRIENCPKFGETDLCEFTEIYGFGDISQWIMALGACTAYILMVFVVGFVLRKRWLPIAKQAWGLRQYQAWEASGRPGQNPFQGAALAWFQSATLRQTGEVRKTAPLWKRIEMAHRRRDIRRRGGTPRQLDYPDSASSPRPITPWRERNRLRKIRKAKGQSGQLTTLEDYPDF